MQVEPVLPPPLRQEGTSEALGAHDALEGGRGVGEEARHLAVGAAADAQDRLGRELLRRRAQVHVRVHREVVRVDLRDCGQVPRPGHVLGERVVQVPLPRVLHEVGAAGQQQVAQTPRPLLVLAQEVERLKVPADGTRGHVTFFRAEEEKWGGFLKSVTKKIHARRALVPTPPHAFRAPSHSKGGATAPPRAHPRHRGAARHRHARTATRAAAARAHDPRRAAALDPAALPQAPPVRIAPCFVATAWCARTRIARRSTRAWPIPRTTCSTSASPSRTPSASPQRPAIGRVTPSTRAAMRSTNHRSSTCSHRCTLPVPDVRAVVRCHTPPRCSQAARTRDACTGS